MRMATESAPRREGLILQRFLALFLFTGAGFFGIGVIAAVGQAVGGDVRAFGMCAATALPAWALVWLGMVLWSGRMIPRWFIGSFVVVIAAGPVVLAFFCKTWMESLVMVGMAAPTAVSVCSILRNYPGTPPKPKTFDEL